MTGHRGGGAPAPHLWKGGFQSAATTNRIQPGPVAPSPRWRISATPYRKADSDPPPRQTKLPDDIAKATGPRGALATVAHQRHTYGKADSDPPPQHQPQHPHKRSRRIGIRLSIKMTSIHHRREDIEKTQEEHMTRHRGGGAPAPHPMERRIPIRRHVIASPQK